MPTSIASAVTTVLRAVIADVDLPTCLDLLCAHLEASTSVDVTATFVLEDAEWRLAGHGTLPEELVGLRGDAAVPSGSLMDQAVASGEPTHCTDLLATGEDLQRRHRRTIAAGLRGVLCVPVIGAGDLPLGVLGLATTSTRVWREDTIAVTRAFADLAGLVLERHRARTLAQHEAERANALSHRLASILDAVPTPTFELDRSGRVARWNRAASLAAGWRADQLVGRPVTAIGEGWEALAPRVEQARSGVASTSQVEVTSRAGAPLVLEVRLNPLIDDDGASSIIGTLTDLTDRLAMETAIRRSQRMEALGTFAGGIAHDFGNILSAILGFADLLDHELPEDAAAPRRDADQIRSLAERGRRLTERLTGFAHSRPVAPADVDVAAGVRDVERILSRSLPPSVEVCLEVDEVPPVQLGEGQLDRVLLNLVSNAGDAMPEGGRVTVRVRHARGRVVLEVEDQGVGIPEANLDRVFEPFFTTKGSQGGTGLGLANVYAIVRGAGGHVEVTSQVDVGTCIRVELPPSTTDDDAGSVPTGASRVLVVDPEPVSRKVLHTALAGAGYRIMAVGDAADVDLGDVARRDPVAAMVCPATAGAPVERSLATLLSRMRQLRPGLALVELGEGNERSREPGVVTIARPYLADQVVAAVDRALQAQPSGS